MACFVTSVCSICSEPVLNKNECKGKKLIQIARFKHINKTTTNNIQVTAVVELKSVCLPSC